MTFQFKVLNPFDISKCTTKEKAICVDQLKSRENVQNLQNREPDVQIILPFLVEAFDVFEYYASGNYITALSIGI